MERLAVTLRLIAGQYKSEARAAASETKNITKAQAEAGKESGKWSKAWQGLGGVVKGFIALQVGRKILEIGKASIDAASALDESINAVEKTFGTATNKITEFGNIAAATAGLSKREFHDLATVTGSLLTNMGFNADAAAQSTIRLTQRAADMASVFNTDVNEVLTAINAGLRGETEPLRRFGVMLSDSAVRAKAVEMGLAATTKEVDLNAKAQAALALIMEQSDKTAGDFVQTTDSLANAQRRSAAIAENAQARFGASLARASAGFVGFAATALDSLAALSGDEVAQANLRMQEAIENINQVSRSGGDAFAALANGLLHLARHGDLTTAQFEALAAAAGLPMEDYQAFTDIVLAQAEAMGMDSEMIEEMRAAMEGATDSAGEMAPAVEEVTDELEDQKKAAEEAKRKLADLRTEYLRSADPIFNAVTAVGRYKEAQEKLDEVTKDRKSTEEDIALAQLAVAEAAIEAETALRNLSSEGKIDQGIRLIAEAAGFSDEQVRRLLESLDVLDGKTVESIIKVTQIGSPDDPIVRRPGGGAVPRAGGGPVYPDRIYRGGEGNRPELLFIPGDQGRVLSNSDSRALIAALSGRGGRSVDFTVNFTSEGADIDAQKANAMWQIARLVESGA